MKRRFAFAVACTLVPGFVQAACGADDVPAPVANIPDSSGPTDAAPPNPQDPRDPRCGTQAALLGVHPFAAGQDSSLGRTISDARGWYGQVYFAYGDLELNTGPIHITSFEPKTKQWIDHPITYRDKVTGAVSQHDSFATHDIPRFVPIGDKLYAPAGQPDFRRFGWDEAPEFAVGTKDHAWAEVDVEPQTVHVGDVIERAPNDIYVVGSAIVRDPDAGPALNRSVAHAWHSVDGGPFTRVFPIFGTGPSEEYFDLTGAWFTGAALNGVAYLHVGAWVWQHDGNTWRIGLGDPLGEFRMPFAFAGHLVFSDLGQLFAFDGAKRKNLEFRLFESVGHFNTTTEPLAIVQATEGHLLAANHRGDLMVTTDLVSWTCIGRVPAEATAVTSLDGVVYFGGIEGRIFAYESRSW